jgi:protein kinase/serine/threonine-protein kinase
MARTSVMQYENDPPPIPEIAESLNVETVMEGSVRYANGRVLITAQLIDGLTGAHLWSGEFNRDLIDVFSVQAEVAEQIAMAMQMELIPEDKARIETRPTESVEAYQLYLFALSLPWGIETRPRFIELLERAIAADPNFAEAYAELAMDYGNAGDIEKAIEYAQKTIELDSTVGLAYLALGYVSEDYFARQEETETLYERAAELSPNDPFILSYYCYRLADDIENIAEALRICRKAVASDPTSAIAHVRLGNVLMRLGDFSEAINQINEAIEILPIDNHAIYLQLATVEYLSGNKDRARENLDFAVQIMSPLEVFRVDYIAYIYGLLGDTDRVENLLTRFEDIYGEDEREAGRTLGWGILGTRDKERSLREWTITIDGYIEDDWPISRGRISRFRDNWLNDPMLEEPEFLELRRRLGFSG